MTAASASSPMRSRRRGAFASWSRTSKRRSERPCWRCRLDSSSELRPAWVSKKSCQARQRSACLRVPIVLYSHANSSHAMYRIKEVRMHAVLISFEESPEQVDRGIEHVEEEVLPVLQDATGLRGFWLVDRERGKRVSVMVWDSEEDANTAMAALAARREELGADRPRPTPSSVETFEVYGSV